MGKWWSDAAAPATCVKCRSLSHVTAFTSNGIFALLVLACALVGVGGVALQSTSFLLIGLGVAAALYYLAWRWARLVTISPEASADRRRFNFGAILVLLLLSLLH